MLLGGNMKSKGFTLVELLATTLVIGIIILIGIPIMSRIVSQSKENAFNDIVSNIIYDIDKKCNSELLLGMETTKEYVFTSSGVEPKIDLKGKLPISGSIEVNSNCQIKITDLSNGKIKASKKFESSSISFTIIGGN